MVKTFKKSKGIEVRGVADCYINGIPVDFKTADMNNPHNHQMAWYKFMLELKEDDK